MKIIESDGKTIIQDGDVNLIENLPKEEIEANIQKYIDIIEKFKEMK